MINKLTKENYHILTYFILYLSILVGFFFNENTTGGPQIDFNHALKQVHAFEENFFYTFLNFDKIDHATRISPIFILILFIFKQIFVELDLVRIILLHILLLTQLIFYFCLKELYYKKLIFDTRPLIVFSCIIFLSPSFRSNIIWPESMIFGLLFFLCSLYFFLKNINKFEKKNIYFNIIFIALASYIRPSFCLFAFYFSFYFLFNFKNRKLIFIDDKVLILKIIILNFLLAFPAIYYVFILDIFFISSGGLSMNYFNKIPIILSMIIFHVIPILFYKKIFMQKKNILKNYWSISILIILISFFLILGFDYNLNLGGGGFILHLSNFLFGNNYFFYFLIPFFIFYTYETIKLEYVNNLLIILVLIFLSPQYHLFEKYYDPLVFILALTILKFNLKKDFFLNSKFLVISYSFYILLFFVTSFNYYYIKF
jgi:hypothetical protein